MTEPHTSSLFIATVAGISLSTLFPGVDGNALTGAFAGASLVAITSKNLSLFTRLAYMLISLVAGYLAAPEIVALSPLHQTGVAAFVASAAAIAFTQHLIELVKVVELPGLFQKGKSRDYRE